MLMLYGGVGYTHSPLEHRRCCTWLLGVQKAQNAYNLDCCMNSPLGNSEFRLLLKKGVGTKLINLLMRGKKYYSLFRCCCFTFPLSSQRMYLFTL